jgi:hypothetical protein
LEPGARRPLRKCAGKSSRYSNSVISPRRSARGPFSLRRGLKSF